MAKKRNKKFLIRGCIAVLLVAMTLCSMVGCSPKDSVGKAASDESEKALSYGEYDKASSAADLYCLEFSSFSGAFVEDGKNEEVEDVAMILVENRAKDFLDRATITYKYGEKTATFVVTGLPAGKKCWVMEKDKLVLEGDTSFEFEDCVPAFKTDAILSSDLISTTTKDNTITIENVSRNTLENVSVYYKNTFDDGNYFGGITYVMNYGTLKPGQTLEKAAGHFDANSRIVRFSYQV